MHAPNSDARLTDDSRFSRVRAPIPWPRRILFWCIGAVVVASTLGSVARFMIQDWFLGCVLLAAALVVEVVTMWVTRPAIARRARR